MTVPYSQDFLQNIKAVNFGSQWFGIDLIDNASIVATNSDITIDISSIAGGTPGASAYTRGVAAPYVFQTPHKITSADLARQLTLDAGAPVIAFGVTTPNTCRVYFQLNRFLPLSTFQVVANIVGHFAGHTFRGFQAFTVKKDAMKVGLTIANDGGGGLSGGPAEASRTTFSGSFADTLAQTFRINPVTLVATGPF